MENQEQKIYALGESKTSHYDKRLILKIVREIENGLLREEAIRIYDLGKASLEGWMRDYGSVEYDANLKRKSFSALMKRTIVTVIEQGRLTIREAKIAYNIISEKSIREWMKQYTSEKVEICIEKTVPMARKKHLLLMSKKTLYKQPYRKLSLK